MSYTYWVTGIAAIVPAVWGKLASSMGLMGRHNDKNILTVEEERVSKEMATFLRYRSDGWVPVSTVMAELHARRVDATEAGILDVVSRSYTKDVPRFARRCNNGAVE
eukprot:2845277-Amphidinium_carterae.1